MLCTFNIQIFILLTSSDNDEQLLLEAKNLNKDSPELTDVSADVSNVDFCTGNKKTFLLFLLPLPIYDLHLSIIQLQTIITIPSTAAYKS